MADPMLPSGPLPADLVTRVSTTPTKEQALEFCLLLDAGMPSLDAVRMFLPALEEGWTDEQVKRFHDRWIRSDRITEARKILGRPEWTAMEPEARIRYAIDKHYTEMAYFLYSTNYATIAGADKTKADTCRAALEAKLAGTSGKTNALDRFYEAVLDGKLKGRIPVQ